MFNSCCHDGSLYNPKWLDVRPTFLDETSFGFDFRGTPPNLRRVFTLFSNFFYCTFASARLTFLISSESICNLTLFCHTLQQDIIVHPLPRYRVKIHFLALRSSPNDFAKLIYVFFLYNFLNVTISLRIYSPIPYIYLKFLIKYDKQRVHIEKSW